MIRNWKKINIKNTFESDTLRGGYRFLGPILILFLLFLLDPSLLQAGINSKAKGEFYALRHQCIITLKNSKALGSRSRVEGLSRRCMAFQKKYPATRYAPRTLYLSGMLWEGLYTHTKYVSDWNQSLKSYSRVIALYPESSLADDALFRRGVLYLKIGLSRLALTEFKKILYRYPKSDRSALRDELKPDSDIDLLVEFDRDHMPGLFDITRMEIELSEIIGRKVDLRTPEDLSIYFRDEVVKNSEVHYDKTG